MTTSASESKKSARLTTLINSEIEAIESAIATAVSNNKFECTITDTAMTRTSDISEPIRQATAHCAMDIYSFVLDAEEEHGLDYQEGDILTLSGITSDTPVKLQVSEVSNTGNVEELEVLDEGIYDNIISVSSLKYLDESKFIDITKPFGSDNDLRLNRDGSYEVRDNTGWKTPENIFTDDYVPTETFGEELNIVHSLAGDYVKYNEIWNKANILDGFPIPDDFGNDFDIVSNLLGKTYIKLHRTDISSWYIVPQIWHVNSFPDAKTIGEGDLVYYTIIRANGKEVVYKMVKYNGVLIQIKNSQEYDWSDKSIADLAGYGKQYDVIYDKGSYYIKLRKWILATDYINMTELFTRSDIGEEYDIFADSGDLYYIKRNDMWRIVHKVWNLAFYDIGHDEVCTDITWNINHIVVDDGGEGYNGIVSVEIDGNDNIAEAVVENGVIKAINVKSVKEIYRQQPVIKFRMLGEQISQKLYKIWKRKEFNAELADAMKYVIDYFTNLNYSIARETNKKEGGKTFNWKIRWY